MLGTSGEASGCLVYFWHIHRCQLFRKKKILSKLIRAFLVRVQLGLSLEYDVYNKSRHTQEMKIQPNLWMVSSGLNTIKLDLQVEESSLIVLKLLCGTGVSLYICKISERNYCFNIKLCKIHEKSLIKEIYLYL